MTKDRMTKCGHEYEIRGGMKKLLPCHEAIVGFAVRTILVTQSFVIRI